MYVGILKEFISCEANFIRNDMVELPIGREFLAKPCNLEGKYFITFYFGWHHQVELVKAVEMSSLSRLDKY